MDSKMDPLKPVQPVGGSQDLRECEQTKMSKEDKARPTAESEDAQLTSADDLAFKSAMEAFLRTRRKFCAALHSLAQ